MTPCGRPDLTPGLSSGPTVGTVVRYQPDTSPGVGECAAVVQEDGALLDSATRRHLTATEAKTCVALLHLDDYVELDQSGAFTAWRTYEPEDRARLIVQRGLAVMWLVRKGSAPCGPQQAERIAAARAAVEDAKARADAADEHLVRARADLAALTRIEIVPEPAAVAADAA